EQVGIRLLQVRGVGVPRSASGLDLGLGSSSALDYAPLVLLDDEVVFGRLRAASQRLLDGGRKDGGHLFGPPLKARAVELPPLSRLTATCFSCALRFASGKLPPPFL